MGDLATTRDFPYPALERFRSSTPPGLVLLAGLLIFSPLVDGGTTHVAVMIIRLIMLALLSLYLTLVIRTGVFPVLPQQAWPAVLAYLGVAAISTACSPYTNQSLQWLVILLSYAGLLYLIMSFVATWGHVATLLIVLVGMGLFEAGWALVQGGWGDVARPTGTFFNPNFLAGYLAVAWSIVLGFFCYVRVRLPAGLRSGRVGLMRLAGPLVLLALLLTAIVWTGSRGGMLATLAGTALALNMRFGRKAVAVLLLGLLVSLLLPTPLRDRLRAEHAVNPVGYARWQIWQSSVHEMVEHPLGVGIGLYQYIYPHYAFPVEGQITRYGKVAQTAHSEYLQMGVELGAISIPLFGLGVLLVAREAGSVLRQRLRRWQRGAVVGLGGGIASILTHAAFDSNLHDPALAIVLTLCVGLVLRARRLSSRVQTERVLPVNFRLAWGVCGAVTVGVMVVGVLRLGLAWHAFETGSQAMARQDIAGAVAAYRTAIVLDPGKALYHSSMAAAHFQIYERTKEPVAAETAIAELQSAMALNPLDGRLPGLLGRVYVALASAGVQPGPSDAQRKSWLLAALSAFGRAADLEPFMASYHFEIGRLRLALGDRRNAEADVRHAVELEPNFLPAREWLAQRHLEVGRIEEANREYQEILQRQQRYAIWTKGVMEERFLAVDVTALAGELEKVRPRT